MDKDQPHRPRTLARALAAAALAAASLLGSPACKATTYTAASTPYAWETTSNTAQTSSYLQTCTGYPIDDDEIPVAFATGFSFNMAGTVYTSARFLSNGQVQLGADNGAFRTYQKTTLPEASSGTYSGCSGGTPTLTMISPAWTDLDPQSGGTLSWQQKGSAPNEYMVFSWNAVPVYGTSTTLTFQVVLYSNGTIKMQYNTISGTTWAAAKPTAGVQVSPTDYTAWTATLANGTAVLYTPAPTLNGFSVVPASSTGSTCSPLDYTVTAVALSGSTLTTYAGTATLSTSTGHGAWTLVSGHGTFVAGAADSGSATYTFAAADLGVATFALSDTHAESSAATAASGAFSGTSSTVSYSLNTFVVAPTDPLGYQVVAGRPHAFSASLYRQDPTTGVCSLATAYSGSKPLDMWYAPTPNHPAGAGAPSVSATATATSCGTSYALPSSAPPVNAASNLITLTFSSGSAPFYLCSSDVGQFAIDVRDDTLSFSQSVVVGQSSTATARPFGLWTDQVQYGALANPGGTASSGSPFAPAQSPFSARVSAKLWSHGQDTLVAGTPDPSANLSGNAATASFAWPTTVAASAQTPAAGVLGALSGGSLPSSSFSGGVATATLSYSEAGSAALAATSPNFLSSGYAVPGVATGQVGRFHPASLSLTQASASNACASGGFTYMGQPFPLSATLSALGSAGGTLTNYDASRGYAFLATPSWRAVNAASGTDLGARLSTPAPPTWTAGVWSPSGSATFARAATPDGQYDSLQIGLSGSDADGDSVSPLDMSYASAGPCSGASCDATSVGSPLRMRHGRLAVSNANASVLPTLRVPVQAYYWASSAGGSPLGWAPNTLDSCTSIPYSDMALGGYQGALASASLPTGSLALSSGSGSILLRRPAGAAISGSASIGLNLGTSAASPSSCSAGLPSVPGASLPWLQSNFCSSSNYQLNPNAKAVWGAPDGKSSSVVFMRENY